MAGNYSNGMLGSKRASVGHRKSHTRSRSATRKWTWQCASYGTCIRRKHSCVMDEIQRASGTTSEADETNGRTFDPPPIGTHSSKQTVKQNVGSTVHGFLVLKQCAQLRPTPRLRKLTILLPVDLVWIHFPCWACCRLCTVGLPMLSKVRPIGSQNLCFIVLSQKELHFMQPVQVLFKL